MDLTARQACLLKAVVEEHHASGRPVGSRTLVDLGIVTAGASTVRNDLVRLEELGLLEAPHTSAGRVPTDLGYRVYVDQVLGGPDGAAGSAPALVGSARLVPDVAGARIDDAIRETTQALAEATQLLTVITAPRPGGAQIRHVELVQLQPTTVVIVIITAAGNVARRVIAADVPLDPGLIDWAATYLDEVVVGVEPSRSALRQRLFRSDLHPAEQAMLALLAPAFEELVEETQDVHVGGSADLLGQLGSDVQHVVNLVAMLDERRRLLDSLRPVLAPEMRVGSRVAVRIGAENDIPELRRLSVVGAAYGVGGRPLGMIGLIGPRSLDYTRAMRAVHIASDGLSSVAEGLYE